MAMDMWPLSILSVQSWTVCILLFMIFVIARNYMNKKWKFLEKHNIPHDPPSLRNLGTLSQGFDINLAFKRDLAQKLKYGPVWGSYNLFTPMITIHDLEILRQIYTKEFSNFPDRMSTLRKLNGKEMNHGLTVVEDMKWKRIRTTLSPTFSSSKLKQMFCIMQECTDETVSVLNGICKSEHGRFIAKEIFSKLSLDIIMSTAVGVLSRVQTENSEMAEQVKNIFKRGFTSPVAIACFLLPKSEWIFEKLNMGIFPNSSLEYLKNCLLSVIENRKKTGQRRPDLLQLLLDAEVPEGESIAENSLKGLRRIEVLGNAMLMIGGGYENTANTLTFLSYNLASCPDAQKRCQEEIDRAYKEKGEFDYEVVKNLKYVEMCLNETMRLYTPILVNSRVCRNETTINGLTIPKGVAVQIPTFAIHHDPEYWDEPWEFKPERMEDMSQIDQMIFQPFGAGPRNCIGMRFAVMEIKLAICKLLHKFSFKLCDDTPKSPLELAFAISIRPKVEFSLQAIPRITHC